jgi:hypothetical protein
MWSGGTKEELVPLRTWFRPYALSFIFSQRLEKVYTAFGYWDFASLEGHGFGCSLVKIKDEHFSIFFWAILAGLPPEMESCNTVYKIQTCALSTLSYVSESAQRYSVRSEYTNKKRFFISFKTNRTGFICFFCIEANWVDFTCETNKNRSEYSLLSKNFEEPNINWGLRLAKGFLGNIKQ